MTLDARELFRNTENFSRLLGYKPRKIVEGKAGPDYSEKAIRLSKFVTRAGNGPGGEGFGCRTEIIHRLVELVLDEPLPPMSKNGKSKKRGENWIMRNLDEVEFDLPLVLVKLHNMHSSSMPLEQPFLLYDQTYYEEMSFSLVKDWDGVENHTTVYLEECRPATYEECRMIAWRHQRFDAPPPDFQPALEEVEQLQAAE